MTGVSVKIRGQAVGLSGLRASSLASFALISDSGYEERLARDSRAAAAVEPDPANWLDSDEVDRLAVWQALCRLIRTKEGWIREDAKGDLVHDGHIRNFLRMRKYVGVSSGPEGESHECAVKDSRACAVCAAAQKEGSLILAALRLSFPDESLLDLETDCGHHAICDGCGKGKPRYASSLDVAKRVVDERGVRRDDWMDEEWGVLHANEWMVIASDELWLPYDGPLSENGHVDWLERAIGELARLLNADGRERFFGVAVREAVMTADIVRWERLDREREERAA